MQVLYQGRMVSRNGFRVYIYDKLGNRTLVNSYDDYLAHVSSDEWFDTKPNPEPIQIAEITEKPRRGRRPKGE